MRKLRLLGYERDQSVFDFENNMLRPGFLGVAFIVLISPLAAVSDEPVSFDGLRNEYRQQVHHLLQRFCLECHSSEQKEGELDLERFQQLSDVRRDPPVWQQVARMLDGEEMPPEDSPQLAPDEKKQLRDWVGRYLDAESQARAGDPGPVVLRRLNNAEYTYTIRDLTEVGLLDPTRQFPVDGAANEGFTNTGTAQGMSPSLVTKYLDAAKQVSRHAVLLPDGIRFSPQTTRRDRTDTMVARIQEFYRLFTDSSGGTAVDLGDGIKFTTNQGGRLSVEKYLVATLVERDALSGGKKTIDAVASERDFSAKYLGSLWHMLTGAANGQSLLLDQLRNRWQTADTNDAAAIAAEIAAWQKVLWKLNMIGHVGRKGMPTSWQEAVAPIVSQQEYELALPKSSDGEDVVLYLSAGDAGDGNESDCVVWKNPRLEGGKQPLALRDVAGVHQRLAELRRDMLSQTTRYLAAVADAEIKPNADLATIAARHEVDAERLKVWLDYLQVGVRGQLEVTGHFTEKQLVAQDHDFIHGWGSNDTPLIQANSSDREVRIPGTVKPHSVYAHPSPTLFAAIGWRSPLDGAVNVEVRVTDAHRQCGNGQEWVVQHRTNRKIGNLWQGEFDGGGSATMPETTITIHKDELVSFMVGPRHGQHGCDLTEVNFSITEIGGARRVWDLAKDVADNILESNPHADRLGNMNIWHFYQGNVADVNMESNGLFSVPSGSLLARWQAEMDAGERQSLAKRVQHLALGDPPADENSPEALLFKHLQGLAVTIKPNDLLENLQPDNRFGKHPLGHAIDSADLVVKAPAVVEFRVPAEFADGRLLRVTGQLESKHGRDGSVQLQVGTTRPESHRVSPGVPIMMANDDQVRRRFEQAFDDFRNLFPLALCYAQIVPIDEIVTLALFHREDNLLKQLILNDDQAAELDRLWDELYFVSQEPIALTVALEQILEFSTQTNPDEPEEWRPLRKPINDRADAFRQRLIETEPTHVEAVLEFANRAWRRPLTDAEHQGLRNLYQRLRDSEIPHEEAIRLTLTRVLTSPAFLYKREIQVPGKDPVPVSDVELATRLSYFLWSSLPDDELRAAAAMGHLQDDEGLVAQANRMLQDGRTRRLAIQFACQWLHLRDFDQNDDKSENLYPEFAVLRHDMYEETVRFFENMFCNDGSILDMLDADHTFLNETLARHYGIGEVNGNEWQRVDGVQGKGRGGVLGMASFLASQSGASRTSPILRGNWIYETILGERLPRPPADVPQLPDEVPKGLTARQMIELHSSIAECAKCHARLDPYGFALEQYDAIGRLRLQEVDTKTTLIDGRTIAGIDGLRDYLAKDRRDDIVRQFCRKLLGFALGREVLLSDTPLLKEMQTKLEANDFQFGVVVDSIITSRQFRDIRGRDMVYNAEH